MKLTKTLDFNYITPVTTAAAATGALPLLERASSSHLYIIMPTHSYIMIITRFINTNVPVSLSNSILRLTHHLTVTGILIAGLK